MAYSIRILTGLVARNKWCAVLIALLLPGHLLLAQCTSAGVVTDVVPGCGAVIKDAASGQELRAVSGGDLLVSGQSIHFSAEPSSIASTCPQDGLQSIALSCLHVDTNTGVADAHFAYSPDPNFPLQYTFLAHPYDPATQVCHWNFGEGAEASVGTQAVMQHVFSQAGTHTVCLKLTDSNNNTVEFCQDVVVNTIAPSPCGYRLVATAVDTHLYSKLLPQNGTAAPLDYVGWYRGETETSFSEQLVLNTTLPDYGSYFVCAKYGTQQTDTLPPCSATLCQLVTTVEPGCVNPQIASIAPPCPVLSVPVCGCDQNTYDSECSALEAGLTGWWAGSCTTSLLADPCAVDMDMHIASGGPGAGYDVIFTNLSPNGAAKTQLDFGDGTSIWETTDWELKTHHYVHGGIYRITLSSWTQHECVSALTKILVTDSYNLTAENLPAAPDYVLPGDANTDLKVNVYDLLNIGVGYAATGVPRPQASTQFVKQFAPNWPQTLGESINYKHFDCDGDGTVLDLDADLILPHYTPIDSIEAGVIPGAPKVWLEFDQDTLYVDPNNPVPLEITASVMVGSPDLPVVDLYGLALALKYPEYVDNNPAVTYQDEFFGSSNHILWLSKDNYYQRQLDLGFTKKYDPSSGHGRIATVTFRSDYIIIIDIIDREISSTKAFSVPIRGLKAIDQYGQKFDISTDAIQDTVWIKRLETSAVHDQALDRQVTIYPNPASQEASLYTNDLDVENLEVVNALGQVVYTATSKTGRVQHLPTGNWTPGIYLVRLQTTRGLAEKKLVVR